MNSSKKNTNKSYLFSFSTFLEAVLDKISVNQNLKAPFPEIFVVLTKFKSDIPLVRVLIFHLRAFLPEYLLNFEKLGAFKSLFLPYFLHNLKQLFSKFSGFL